MEAWLRKLATFPNIYVIGVFDSCRRDKGMGEMHTTLSECKNLAVVYREESVLFDDTEVCLCEVNMADNLFKHLKAAHTTNRQNQVQIRMPLDLQTFNLEVEMSLKGWNDPSFFTDPPIEETKSPAQEEVKEDSEMNYVPIGLTNNDSQIISDSEISPTKSIGSKMSTPIYRVLKQRHPNKAISVKAMAFMNDMVNNSLHIILTEASQIR